MTLYGKYYSYFHSKDLELHDVLILESINLIRIVAWFLSACIKAYLCHCQLNVIKVNWFARALNNSSRGNNQMHKWMFRWTPGFARFNGESYFGHYQSIYIKYIYGLLPFHNAWLHVIFRYPFRCMKVFRVIPNYKQHYPEATYDRYFVRSWWVFPCIIHVTTQKKSKKYTSWIIQIIFCVCLKSGWL